MRISDWSSDVCSSDLLADTAPLGAWSVEARVDRDGEPLGRLGFHVEEFIPERLKIDLAADAPALHPDRPVTVTATARFLYGPPAADLDGSAEMPIEPAPAPFTQPRAAERRVGQGCGGKCRSRGAP